MERFLQTETGSGTLLLAGALVALVWSNVAAESYDDFWSTHLTLELGSLSLEENLRLVVNDLLMTVFFYVVALEVKREIRFGSLRNRASAAIPVAAALGTMVGAAVVYLAVNIDGGELRGWAVPIATDIAFVLAVLGVAGHRAPPELRAFMLTLAVVDDLGTIVVIALFFSGGISLAWLAGAAGALVAVVVLQRLAVRLLVPYVVAAGALWLATFESGIHPTIAGVALGFLTPALAFHPRAETGESIGEQLTEIADNPDAELSEATMWEVAGMSRESVSPLARLETQLHPWSAYVILPLFALANAGVTVSPDALVDALTGQVGLGIALGLVVGAPLGGFLLARGQAAVSRTPLPEGLDWLAVGGATPLKGIGFTVAIFMSVLAFDDAATREEAKLAILVASVIAGLIGFIALVVRHRIVRGRAAES